ncbi:MAG: pabB [Bacillales bacterium]|jgi:para-aminobenzoate synthetase component 1|nr:pabB [Bacillales bacterium]
MRSEPFLRLESKTKRKPVGINFTYEKSFFDQYKLLSSDKVNHCILDSARDGRYSIVGLEPEAIIEGKDSILKVTTDNSVKEYKGNILDKLKEVLLDYRSSVDDNLPYFSGGLIGFFSYDCMRYIEKIDSTTHDDLNLPDLLFYVYNDVFVYDHKESLLWIITNKTDESDEEINNRLQNYKEMWNSSNIEVNKSTYQRQNIISNLEYSFDEKSFGNAVEKIREYIAAGDVFQVNLSTRQAQILKSQPIDIYTTLRQINPSPYMAYMECENFQIVSGSPELLVNRYGTKLNTRPIAGTRSRGETQEDEDRLINELLMSDKECAEHIMLVDLERNDLGRVSKYGSVLVNELMVIEKYSHVMHIVSNVQGDLEENMDNIDIVKAMFPGGTITGAPKVRTMEIIEELESVRRGIYTGSIGWIGFNENMELNIVIRTLLAKDGLAYVQAGAGIVIDSNPKHEYKESLKKATALWTAKAKTEKI